MKSPHTSLLSLETQHGLADMVASGKTHNIIGTKLWNMQYGGWLLFVCAGRVLWGHRGTFDFCSCTTQQHANTLAALSRPGAVGGASRTQRGTLRLHVESGLRHLYDITSGGRGLKNEAHLFDPALKHSLIGLFLVIKPTILQKCWSQRVENTGSSTERLTFKQSLWVQSWSLQERA